MLAQLAPRGRNDDIRAALEAILGCYYQVPCVVGALHRRRSLYSSSCSIENLQAHLDSGERLRLVLKDTSPDALAAFGHNVRLGLLCEPQREPEVYQRVLHAGLGTPVCYGAICSRELQRYWLFLERVEGAGLWQFGKMGPWQEAARWLARLHTELAPSSSSLSCASCEHLLQYDSQYFTLWLARAEKFLSRSATLAPTDSLRGFGRLTDRYDRVLERLTALPKTFIHGEFYPSNILIRSRVPTVRVCPIDWEMAGIGPAILDLAALTSGKWDEDAKAAMVTAYRDVLEPQKGPRPSVSELEEAVDCCQLQICIQWLGWADSWSPPEGHTHDWLREALRLAEKLAL